MRDRTSQDNSAKHRENSPPAKPRDETHPQRLSGSAGASPSQPAGPLPKRSRPASGVLHIEGKPTIIYDTVCTKDRQRWLTNDDVHTHLRQVWIEADTWAMGRYIIMPDHIHYFAGFTGSLIEYENWVRYWKSQFTKRYQVVGRRWQTSNWDTRIRSWRQYEEKWEYVRWNPVRHELVDHPDNWPYQGTIHELRWEE